MRVLAVDPGFDRIGIAVIEHDGRHEHVVFSECFITNKKDTFYARLAAVGGHIAAMIEKYGPDALAIETLFFSINAKTAMRVAEARGAIIYQAAARDIPIVEYSPQQIKIAVTGYGKASKEQVANMAKRLARLDTTHSNTTIFDDEMDAIALGITHCAIHTIRLK